MLDFDYVCQRSEPSVSCMVYPMVGGDSKQNFYWGHKEVLVPGKTRAFFKTVPHGMRSHGQQTCNRSRKTKIWMTFSSSFLFKVYKSMADAMRKHPDADVMVSFASLRSAYDSTIECLEYPQIRTIAIIAEGIPENMTRKLIKLSSAKGVSIIGE